MIQFDMIWYDDDYLTCAWKLWENCQFSLLHGAELKMRKQRRWKKEETQSRRRLLDCRDVCDSQHLIHVIDSVDRTQSDFGEEDSNSAVVVTTDAVPTSLPHDLHLSFKDFIIGYPTQTGRVQLTTKIIMIVMTEVSTCRKYWECLSTLSAECAMLEKPRGQGLRRGLHQELSNTSDQSDRSFLGAVKKYFLSKYFFRQRCLNFPRKKLG